MTRNRQRHWLVLAVLIALAGFLRFYQLDSQLWLDEVSALTGSYRNSFWQILTVFPEHFPHPLYEQMAHASLVSFGESPFAIRLPAAIFGLAGVFMFYRLSRRLSGECEALLGTGLLAVSYHHIYFSQNARGYTLYLFLALVATDLLLSLLKEMRWQTALAYVGVAAFAAYSQTAGIALAPGQLLVALVVVCSMRKAERVSHPKPWHLIAMFVLTALLVLLLYAPIIGGNVGYTSTVAGGEAPVARSARIFDVIVEVLHGLVPSLSTGVILALVAVVCAIGAWDFLHRQKAALAMLIVPVLMSLLGMVALGAALHSRYFVLALIIAYLLGTRGLVIMYRKIRPLSQVGWEAPALATTAIVLAALPLLSYFSMPKQDFLGALREVRAAARPGDRTTGADLAAHVYQKYYAPDFASVETLDDLLREEANGQAVWVITTFERIEAKRRPDLLARLHGQYQLVRTLPGSTEDGEMRIYHRTAAVPPGGSP